MQAKRIIFAQKNVKNNLNSGQNSMHVPHEIRKQCILVTPGIYACADFVRYSRFDCRPCVQIRLSLPDGAQFVLGFPPPTEWPNEDQRAEEVFLGEEAHKPGDEVPVTSSAPQRLPEEQESLFPQISFTNSGKLR
jgi:hypothetical protein